MKKQFGLTRKILRFGKVVEHIKAAAIASDAKGGDEVLRFCAVGRQLGYAGYMALDHMTVACILSFLERFMLGIVLGGSVDRHADKCIARCNRNPTLHLCEAPPT